MRVAPAAFPNFEFWIPKSLSKFRFPLSAFENSPPATRHQPSIASPESARLGAAEGRFPNLEFRIPKSFSKFRFALFDSLIDCPP
jgi:hypothetical protein